MLPKFRKCYSFHLETSLLDMYISVHYSVLIIKQNFDTYRFA